MKLVPQPSCPPCARLGEIIQLRREVLTLSQRLFNITEATVRIPHRGKIGRDKWTIKREGE